MTRQTVTSGAPWETSFGYRRAIRVGPSISVSGTTGVDENGRVVGPGDAFLQAEQALKIIREALESLGASMADVVRSRVFVTDITQWEAVGRAHAVAFKDAPPASTMVEISRLIDPEMMVEIEVDAYVE